MKFFDKVKAKLNNLSDKIVDWAKGVFRQSLGLKNIIIDFVKRNYFGVATSLVTFLYICIFGHIDPIASPEVFFLFPLAYIVYGIAKEEKNRKEMIDLEKELKVAKLERKLKSATGNKAKK